MRPEGGHYFRIEVEDSGIGIGAHDLGRLFSKFEQLDSPASKEQGGTGLGLALTKRLVESQGGSVGVKSEPGKGSIFHAVLPRKFFGTGAFQQTVAGSLEDAKVLPELSNVFARALTSAPSPPTPAVRTGLGS
jgi:hypothetical protein